MKKWMVTILMVGLFVVGGCQQKVSKKENVTILIAAAASLENSLEELIPMFEAAYPNVKVEGTYDSSGKLQAQLESGLEAAVFMSASKKQMDALIEEGYIDQDTVVDLLENELVLIKHKNRESKATDFYHIQEASLIAMGDSVSVPAGQYAQEALQAIGNYDEVIEKASLGTNVTEVLSWVEAGSAEVGIVYASDAASSDQVEIIASLPKGVLKTPVMYPVGMVKNTTHSKEANLFLTFLQSEEAKAIFEKYGFRGKTL